MNLNKHSSLQFLLGLGITIAYVPGLIGAAIPTGWLYLIIVAPILFSSAKLTTNTILILIFLVYASLSFLWTANINIALFHFLQLVALVLIFFIGSTLKDLRPTFKGLTFGLGISGLIAITQYFDFKSVFTQFDKITGLFVNPNIYSEVTIIILIALIVLKLWWWIPLTLPGIILVHSRTAIAAFGIGIFILIFKKNKYYAILAAIIVGLTGAYLYRNNFNILSIQERFNLWKDTAKGMSFFGNGVGSFEILYPLNASNIDTSVARPRYAHNDFLQLTFEFGIAVLLLIFVSVNLLRNRADETIILWAVGVISMFAFPFHVPVLVFIGCLVAGYLNSFNGSVWDTWDNSRPNLFGWIKEWGFKFN